MGYKLIISGRAEREHDPVMKKKQRKAHTGLFTAAAISGELGAAQQKKTSKFRIGDHVRTGRYNH